MANFIGMLQEKCQEQQQNKPTYLEVETDDPNTTLKKCLCKMGCWTTEGSGYNKKFAKQNAAELMLEKIETDIWLDPASKNECKKPDLLTTKMKINVFCGKNQIDMPFFDEKEPDGGLFVVECTFDNHTVTSKGSTKKAAKELALEEIANHFGIHKYYDNYLKKKERQLQQKTPVDKLLELCQAKKLLKPLFSEELVKNASGSTEYVVICSMKDLHSTKSKPNVSKKHAKAEAAAMMFEQLVNPKHLNTPNQGQI